MTNVSRVDQQTAGVFAGWGLWCDGDLRYHSNRCDAELPTSCKRFVGRRRRVPPAAAGAGFALVVPRGNDGLTGNRTAVCTGVAEAVELQSAHGPCSRAYNASLELEHHTAQFGEGVGVTVRVTNSWVAKVNGVYARHSVTARNDQQDEHGIASAGSSLSDMAAGFINEHGCWLYRDMARGAQWTFGCQGEPFYSTAPNCTSRVLGPHECAWRPVGNTPSNGGATPRVEAPSERRIAWQPLEVNVAAGDSLRELARTRHPLEALARGEIPAIVLRNVLSASAAAAATELLMESFRSYRARGSTTTERPRTQLLADAWLTPRPNRPRFHVLGPSIGSYQRLIYSENASEIGELAQALSARADAALQTLRRHNLTGPLDAIRTVLSALSGRQVPVGATDSQQLHALPGQFRLHRPGSQGFALHIDTYQALGEWERARQATRRTKCRALGLSDSARSRNSRNPIRREWTDAVPTMRARAPNGPAFTVNVALESGQGGEVLVTDAHWRDVVADCACTTAPSQSNIIFDDHVARELLSRVRRRTFTPRVGDMYIFASARAHAVQSSWSSPRLTYGAFFDLTPDEPILLFT